MDAAVMSRRWIDAADTPPDPDTLCEAQVVDNGGRYLLPFPVQRLHSGVWRNARHGNIIEPRIVQWRPWPIGWG
jgi:hypothetical protein